MPIAMTGSKPAVLPDGRVLIFGGHTIGPDPRPQRQSVIFDPATRSFSLGPETVLPRDGAATALMSDGRILLVGGRLSVSSPRERNDLLRSAEIFNPATGEFRLTGVPIARRADGLAVQLSDGRVLVTGGTRLVGAGPKAEEKAVRVSELYDPETGRFTRIGTPAEYRPRASLLALADGRALIAGGLYGSDEGDASRSAEVFMPDRFNPRIRISKVISPARPVEFGRPFRIFVRLNNRGRGSAPAVTACTPYDWYGFLQRRCPKPSNIGPGTSRWVVIKLALLPRNKEATADPRLVFSRKIKIFARVLGVSSVRTVTVKARK